MVDTAALAAGSYIQFVGGDVLAAPTVVHSSICENKAACGFAHSFYQSCAAHSPLLGLSTQHQLRCTDAQLLDAGNRQHDTGQTHSSYIELPQSGDDLRCVGDDLPCDDAQMHCPGV